MRHTLCWTPFVGFQRLAQVAGKQLVSKNTPESFQAMGRTRGTFQKGRLGGIAGRVKMRLRRFACSAYETRVMLYRLRVGGGGG